jgi:uncharacterized membrane protein YphA (DoxX/SURF4 family)
MKTTKVLYWVFTLLFIAMMVFSAIPNVIINEQSVELIHKQMGYPIYFIPFVGWAKIIGCIVLLIPGFPRIKEWAYAGLFFDLIGATYSTISLGTPAMYWWLMLIFIGMGVASYIFYHKKLKITA